jgi:hypothetical protein
MPKKQMKFKDGGKVKHYYTGSQVSKSSDSENSSDLRGKALPPIDEMESINANVRRALAGERPPAPEFTEMSSPKAKDNKFVKAVEKVQKSQAADPRMLEAKVSRGAVSPSTPFNQVPRSGRLGTAESEALEGSHPEMIVNPASLGIKTIASAAKSLANMGGRNPLKLAENAKDYILSSSGQRLKDLEQLRKTMFPGRNAAVTNPNAWTAGPKGMEKIAETEGRAAAAEARAATAATKKKAAQAKKDAKDPVMNAKPGADKANSGYKYEGDGVFPPMYKKGGAVKKFAKGGSVSSASSRADGCAIRGKTKGMISKMKSGGMC